MPTFGIVCIYEAYIETAQRSLSKMDVVDKFLYGLLGSGDSTFSRAVDNMVPSCAGTHRNK